MSEEQKPSEPANQSGNEAKPDSKPAPAKDESPFEPSTMKDFYGSQDWDDATKRRRRP